MKFQWLFLICFVAAGAVSAQYSDELEDGWWSHSVSEEDLGLKLNSKEEPADGDGSIDEDYPFFDFPNSREEDKDEDNVSKTEDLVSPEDLEKLLDEADAALGPQPINFKEDDLHSSDDLDILNVDVLELNKDTISNDKADKNFQPQWDDDSDRIVQEEIDLVKEELNNPKSAINNFDDYQFEDNRSDIQVEETLDVKNESPPKSDEESELLIYPEFAENIDDVQNENPEEEQIIDDANKLIEEENSTNEEDFESDTFEKANLPETQKQENTSDENESDADLFDENIENQQNEEIENFVNEFKDQEILDSEKDNDEDINQGEPFVLEAGDPDGNSQEQTLKLENNDADDDNNSEYALSENDNGENSSEKEAHQDPEDFAKNEDLSDSAQEKDDSFQKYVNDMINPEDNDGPDFIDENQEVDEISSEDKDTVDKVYADLNADLAKLFETWDKLTDDTNEDSVHDPDDSNKDLNRNAENNENVLEYEEKYGKPFREDVVLSQRYDYDNYGDVDDENMKDSLNDIFKDVLDTANDNDGEDSIVSTENDSQDDKILVNLEIALKPVIEGGVEEETYEVDNVVENKTENVVEATIKTIQVEDLTPDQYNDLMEQFATVHASEIDTQSEDFGKNIAAVHITLSADEVTEITSPNYPNPYPTNNVVDWILEGEGTGIELNITNLDVRGAQSDFLLIKPGGEDDTGHEGLIFSYHLNEPRMYRFTDVSRVFVRFQSGLGLGFLSGFRMTVKMIWPPQEFDSEELPQPEALLPPPPATLTVNLGGAPYPRFIEIQEQFRRIVADMATMYINTLQLDAGLNTTLETAQITNVASCNINWPGWLNCVEVKFGVPLVYEDEELSRLNDDDLKTMWETFVTQDPFAARFRSLGIMEFAVPNDSRVMLTWVILAVGAVLAAALLGLTLWRYSCFQDYTRMPSFSDTDSIREQKRGLDLYPTPHQTLPPLYADADYKWADDKYNDTARVDLGGFTNTNYARDELLDIDSDEEVITARDRYTTDV